MQSITKAGDACYVQYQPSHHVIHVVGPDFHSRKCTKADAVRELAEAYRNIFVAFLSCSVPTLRLLPVSGDIFSASFKADMPRITIEAIRDALRKLQGPELQAIQKRSICMCIYEDTAYKCYSKVKWDIVV